MADPRGHAFTRSNEFRHQPRPKAFDHPTKHGWVEIGISDVDGCTIFDLDGIAQMKADLSKPDQWIGNILVDGEWLGFEVSGRLDYITERVRQMAGNFDVPFNGEPEPMYDEPATSFEEYGLMGTR